MPKSRILVVDDEPGMLEVCSDILRKLPQVEVVLEGSSPAAAERLRTEPWDLLLADIRLPGLGGVALLEIARRRNPDLPVLMMTAYPTVESAIESMKRGAADYITKPFLPDDLFATVRRLLEGERLRQEHRLLQRQVDRPYAFGAMIGRSPAMLAVFDTIEQIADTDADVLILGETGTGKELVARCLHRQSRRRDHRFVPVDCGAIPEDLLESELFGHERGAFTGATSRSLGLLEFASRGTFFLDEIGHLPLKLQAKLLRALQERRIRRVGDTNEIDIDVRIVAATALDLADEIQAGRFRADFYYRINVARIELPPLREREGDIPLLVSHFFDRHAREMGREGVEIDPDALDVLIAYPWPGNVRQLQNIVKRMLVMTRGDRITAEDVPDEIVQAAGGRAPSVVDGFFDLRERHLAAFEQQHLTSLLRSHHGDVSHAAESARVPRGTFYRLLKKHGIDPAAFRD